MTADTRTDAAATRVVSTSRGGWRARSSIAEGIANLRAGATLCGALVAILALAVAIPLLADVITADRIVAAEAEYLDRGGDLLVAEATHGESLDATACESLAGVAGVRAAAAVTVKPGAVRLSGRPESQQTIVLATPGVLTILGAPDLSASEVLVSDTIAEQWQWAPGSRLQLSGQDAVLLGAPIAVMTVVEVVDLGLLSEAASTGILLMAPPVGDADSCYVRIDPQYRTDLRAAVPAVLGETSSGSVLVSDRRAASALAQDPVAAFESRATRWAGAAAGAIVGLLWAVVAWTRRSRAALYASIGVPAAGGILIRWTEGAAVVITGGLWGTVIAVSVAVAWQDASPGVAVETALRGGGLAVAVALLLVILVGLWRPRTLEALKDR